MESSLRECQVARNGRLQLDHMHACNHPGHHVVWPMVGGRRLDVRLPRREPRRGMDCLGERYVKQHQVPMYYRRLAGHRE